jgi:nucleoside phosphorylase
VARTDRKPAPHVLIVAAHRLELEGFSVALGAEFCGEVRGLRVAAASVGVGMTAAGAGTARRLLASPSPAAILVGSCGFYPGHAPFVAGALFVPDRLCAVDAAVLAGKAAFPQPMPTVLEPDDELSSALAMTCNGVRRGTLGTTLAITTDDALAHELAQRSGCEAENLEALAVGLCCQTLGVTFGAVLGCTNEVGSHGRAQWAEHHERAAQATAELVLRWLARGAPGLPMTSGQRNDGRRKD